MDNKQLIYQKTMEAYNKIASEYASKYNDIDLVIPFINRFICDLPKFAFILDLGCGHGRDIQYFEKKDFIIVGVDNSIELVKIALVNTRSPIFEMDMRKLEFSENSFEAVWANAVLHHAAEEDLPKIINNIKKVLKPKGKFFISVRNCERECWDNKYKPVSRYFNYLDIAKLKKLLVTDFNIDFIEERHDEANWLHIFAHKKY